MRRVRDPRKKSASISHLDVAMHENEEDSLARVKSWP
jgi:hypothetical protein